MNACSILVAVTTTLACLTRATAAPPTDDPAAALRLTWTATLPWANVIDLSSVAGSGPDEKLAAAQNQLAAKGGGVVYFPPGEYRFKDSIKLLDGIILRGAPPAAEKDARNDGYRLESRLEFPKYEFKAEGDGTPNDTAFKGIALADPAAASNCGVVDLAIHRGHIHFGEGKDQRCGSKRIVFGCILTNTAYPWPAVPNVKNGQHGWQRYTHPFGAAIEVKSAENMLIANNRIPQSGGDNFTMNGYVLFDRKRQQTTIDGVVFDYDNRPGIYANHAALGGPGGNGPDDTPETNPAGFRKGTVIHRNHIYCSGRCAIGFSGDGVVCSDNVIRFAKDAWRPTAIGDSLSAGSSTNDNRAVEMRGWRWKVTGNDYEVYSNWCADRSFRFNDGEGLMHEDHCNSTIKDSVLSGNRGNRYLSLYWCAGIDGLTVEDNHIQVDQQKDGAIWVDANRTSGQYPIRNVTIRNNTVNGAIRISGSPAANNLVTGNRFTGSGESRIDNFAGAKVEGNQGFTVNTERSEKEKKMFAK